MKALILSKNDIDADELVEVGCLLGVIDYENKQ